MGVLAVELFAIPVGIIGDGFADWAADNVGAGGDDDDAALPAKAEPVGGASGWLYGFVQGRNAAGEWYESVLFYLVFATVVQQSIETLPAWKAEVKRTWYDTSAADWRLRSKKIITG